MTQLSTRPSTLSQLPVTIGDWLSAYRTTGARPRELVTRLMTTWPADDPAWITRAAPEWLEPILARLDALDPASLPLYGVPFAVKDNIDIAGLPTTAACPAFAFTPERHAEVVRQLIEAGAVPVGKTNLDQFATGLVGTRSPYGAVPNTFRPAYVSGGSSSGSASVVARGLVPFALGTDTAGSGRIPAGFNNLVGLKPSPGLVPMSGVLPACRTLDVVSVLALTVSDAARVAGCWQRPKTEAAFAHPEPGTAWLERTGQSLRVGIPTHPGCDAALGFDAAFDAAVEHGRSMGWTIVPIDMDMLDEVARLLYEGPWVAERHSVIEALLEQNPDAVDPVVRAVIEQAHRHDATATFRARYRLAELETRLGPLWQSIDLLMVPTAPTCPTLAEVADDPIGRNSALGRYTNFVNLLGLSALALPASLSSAGLPFGITLIAGSGRDAALAHLGLAWEENLDLPLGCRLGERSRALAPATIALKSAPTLAIAAVGAHLAGLPLHGQLVERGCRLLKRIQTAPHYRLHALPGTIPPKPGLVRTTEGGYPIEVEVYEMPQSEVGSFLAGISAPLGLGSIELADGTWVHGFVCEASGTAGAEDISEWGGWRAYLSGHRASRT
jgi:allophanate hydrolase